MSIDQGDSIMFKRGALTSHQPPTRGAGMTKRLTNTEHLNSLAARVTARRWFLKECGVGLGSVALASLLGDSANAGTDPLAPKKPHFAPKAKRVVFLFMAGAP